MPSSVSSGRVFVSNLPEPYELSSLREMFETHGTIIDISIIWTMGFIEFETQEEANKAVKELNKRSVDSNKINVMLASLANTLTTVSAASATSTTKTPICSRLFIGNLDEKVTKADLIKIFDQYGTINMCDVKKSYGFIRFDTLEAAAAARQALDRFKVMGKPLRIDFAEPRRKAKLFVGGLAENQSAEELKERFSEHGIVLDVSVMNGFGFVHFDDDQDAQKAVQALHHSTLNGKSIKVEVSTSEVHKVPPGGLLENRCYKCGDGGHFAKECDRTNVAGPATKRARGSERASRHRPLSPPTLMRDPYPPPPPRYADPYGPGRDPYGYPSREPLMRPDPYDAPYGARDPYGYPRESVTYPGFGRPTASSSAYDLAYDRPIEGRRKPLLEAKPQLKRRR